MKKILVVVDIQNDFVDGALGTKEAEGIIQKASDIIRDFEGEIFVTFDSHNEDYMETSEGKNLPVPHCIKGTEGWKLNNRISEALTGKDFTAVEKPSFGSLELPKLLQKIIEGDNAEITLIGLCTDICVVSNALILKANFPEARIAVDASACAGVTPESHNAALNTMKMCQIDIL